MRTMLKRVALAFTLAVTTSASAQAQLTTWDFNANDGGWTTELVSGTTAWSWTPGFWQVGSNSDVGLARLLSPVGTANGFVGGLSIFHSFNFEPDGGECFDGGVLSYRINGGAWTPLDPMVGGYNGSLSSDFGNPLGGQDAWCGNSGGNVFAGTIALVNPGDTYQLAFNAAWDSSVLSSAPNWRIDRVDVAGFAFEDVSTVPEPSTVALLATGLIGMGVAAKRRKKV